MKMNPINPDSNNRVIYFSELVLFGFAALLLAAAIQPDRVVPESVPVKVNLPAAPPAELIANTEVAEAPIETHQTSTQTTALLTNSQGTLPVALTANPENPKLVN